MVYHNFVIANKKEDIYFKHFFQKQYFCDNNVAL